MKIAKKEVIEVKGLDWLHEIPVETEDFTSIDEILIEAATRGVELEYYSNPDSFRLGSALTVAFKKNLDEKRHMNSYLILCNASMFKMGESMRKKVMEKINIDLSKQPIVVK